MTPSTPLLRRVARGARRRLLGPAPKATPSADPDNHWERVAKPMVKIETLIDVGVSSGTPKLYEAFPRAHLVLVEPMLSQEDKLRRRVAGRSYDIVEAAAGASDGTATLSVYEERQGLNTLMQRTELARSDVAVTSQKEVRVRTLDEIVATGGYQGPFGLKIDTEGYELEVLKGGRQMLADTAFVLAEASLAPRFDGSYSFRELVDILDDHGFVLHDILRSAYVDSTKNVPWHGIKWIDAYFVNEKLRPAVP